MDIFVPNFFFFFFFLLLLLLLLLLLILYLYLTQCFVIRISVQGHFNPIRSFPYTLLLPEVTPVVF